MPDIDREEPAQDGVDDLDDVADDTDAAPEDGADGEPSVPTLEEDGHRLGRRGRVGVGCVG